MPVDANKSAADEFVASLRTEAVDQVRIVFLDYCGLSRARALLLDQLPRAISGGVNFSSPTVDFNARDLFPADAAFNLASPDFWAKPDLSTYVNLSYLPHVGQVYANLVDAAGEPWAGCPRTALVRVVDRAAENNLQFNVGFEPEGYLFKREAGHVEFLSRPEFATVGGLDAHQDFVSSLLGHLGAQGVEVQQWSKEYGPGQIEINLRHALPLAAADALVTFKETFRAVARHRGLHGTFMPKPFNEHSGCGLHVHLSASNLDEPSSNLFSDPSDDLGLSQLGRHALGGLIKHGEALTALGATTVNSYKRFLPGSWAPTHLTYAYASRAAFVRIPERETARRLELRIGDAACNPHIYLAAILAAMLDGIEQKLDPGPPLPGDGGTLTRHEATSAGIRPVPPSLDRALEHLEQDDVIRGALGALIAGEFIKVKLSEWDEFRLNVGDWDRDWYMERF